MRLLARILLFIDRSAQTLFIAGALMYFSLVFVLSGDVCLRYLARRPTIWAVDVARYALLWGTLLGAASLVKQDQHIKIDFVIQLLSSKTRRILDIFSSGLCTVVCLIIFIYSADLTWDHFIRGVRVVDPVDIPKFIPLMSMPLGSLLLALAFATRACRTWRDRERIEEEGKNG